MSACRAFSWSKPFFIFLPANYQRIGKILNLLTLPAFELCDHYTGVVKAKRFPYQSEPWPARDERLAPALADQGISHIQSHRWQKIVDIPEEVFEEFIDETKAKEVKKILPLGDFFSLADVQVAHHFIH